MVVPVLKIGSIVLGAEEVPRAVAFWSRALNYHPRHEVAEDWAVLVPADGVPGPNLSIARSETLVQDHPRVHLDLYAGDVTEQSGEIDRLVALGAERVMDWDGYDEDSDFVVLADTEGNRFCVVDSRFQSVSPQP